MIGCVLGCCQFPKCNFDSVKVQHAAITNNLKWLLKSEFKKHKKKKKKLLSNDVGAENFFFSEFLLFFLLVGKLVHA